MGVSGRIRGSYERKNPTLMVLFFLFSKATKMTGKTMCEVGLEND